MFVCRKLIVSAGAWINHVLGSIGLHIPVYVTQEQVTYFATPHIKEFTKEKYTKIIKSLQFSILTPLHQYTYTVDIKMLSIQFVNFCESSVILFGFTILRSMIFMDFQFMAIPEVRLALTLAALWLQLIAGTSTQIRSVNKHALTT